MRVEGQCSQCGDCCRIFAVPFRLSWVIWRERGVVQLPIAAPTERSRAFLKARGATFRKNYVLLPFDKDAPEPCWQGRYSGRGATFVANTCPQLVGNRCGMQGRNKPAVCHEYPMAGDSLDCVPSCTYRII